MRDVLGRVFNPKLKVKRSLRNFPTEASVPFTYNFNNVNLMFRLLFNILFLFIYTVLILI